MHRVHDGEELSSSTGWNNNLVMSDEEPGLICCRVDEQVCSVLISNQGSGGVRGGPGCQTHEECTWGTLWPWHKNRQAKLQSTKALLWKQWKELLLTQSSTSFFSKMLEVFSLLPVKMKLHLLMISLLTEVAGWRQRFTGASCLPNAAGDTGGQRMV